ncbi:MAG: hypothetical protein JSV44_01940 [Candidatus Zixiibacteriota bacterium]|nr:MAG: hypothetical protein JSV44_01940 [candidate division Zixibacteria bacterium]
MARDFSFTFAKIADHFRQALQTGYRVITCREYVDYKKSGQSDKILVNRVDIDFSCRKAGRLAAIFNELEIKASFFVRLHAPEYNPFSFENYRRLRFIRDSGHEIGYHSEVIDEAAIWEEDAAACLRRDIKVLRAMLDTVIYGVASHGGMTGLNNLDFWKDREPSDFDLLYEAYDDKSNFDLFNNSFYVSDSDWTSWKCYDRGKLKEGDQRNLAEHCRDGHRVIYSLIHPDTYFDEHFYE